MLDPASSSVRAGPGGEATMAFAPGAPGSAGAMVYDPTSAPSGDLNPRSCVTCRRRKVRCDKHMPCSNCRRAQIPCAFPGPERAPRRPRRKDPNTVKQQSSERELELVKRLRKLEGIVEELSGQIELETGRHQSASGDSPEAVAGGSGGPGTDRAESLSGASNISNSPLPPKVTRPGSGGAGLDTAVGPLARDPSRTPKDVQSRFGRLVLNDQGRSRYISNTFWSKINDELDELRAETQKLSEDDSDASDSESSPEQETMADADADTPEHQAFIFGYRSCDADLRSLHPLASQISYMWQIFQENVDPLVKVLHVPTINKLIRQVRTSLENLTPATEALMFAMYYAAVISLDEEEVKTNFAADKSTLIGQYRFAVEQALARAEFLTSIDLTTLQALVLFLVLVRRHTDTRLSWTLTGLAIRIAHSIGLHRDGTNFPSLSVYEVEMRRRLWWAICIIDLRAAEDQGTDLNTSDRAFDTQLPLNINDQDIDTDSTSFPPARVGPTDMTFCLIRYEICSVARQLHASSTGIGAVQEVDTLEEREQMIRDVYRRVESKYLNHSSSEGDPIYWVATNIARVIVSKMTLVVYQPVLFPAPGSEQLAAETRDRLFTAATEVFEYNYMLTTDPRTGQWRWLFATYTQWHALAYILMEVLRRPWSSTVERAWAALNSVFSNLKTLDIQKMLDNTTVWLPFKTLYAKARRYREAEIERLKADPQAAVQLDMVDRARCPAPTFAFMNSGIEYAKSREQWRKLVGNPPLPPATIQPPKPPIMSTASHPDHGGGSSHRPSADQLPGSGMDGASELMEAVFSSPTFEPTDMFPMAFAAEMSTDLAREAVFGFGSADIPRQDETLTAYHYQPQRQPVSGISDSAAPNASGLAHGMGAVPPTSATTSDTPLVDAIRKDHPPPWLWDESYTQPDAFPASAAAAAAQPVVEALDVDMNDDFDWRHFGENLRDLTQSSTSGIWSSHI